MEKVIAVLMCADPDDDWCARQRGPVAEALLELGLPGLSVNVRDAPVRHSLMTLTTLQRMRADGEKIACLTCYDASFAMLLDAADVDVVLVGDTLGMVIQGHDTTVPVSIDHMVYQCAAVARGLQRPFLIGDMPFMSYPTKELALTNAVRLMQEGGATGAPQIYFYRKLNTGDEF